MSRVFSAYFIVLLLVSCSNVEGEKQVKKHDNGKTAEIAYYVNDTLHGARQIFNTSGELIIEENYNMGFFEGTYRTYYTSGELQSEGQYIDNIMKGEWKKFYPSGQVMESVEFDQNLENGPFVEYHDNGKLAAKGHYKDGDNEHGLLELFDTTGTLIRKMECDLGICNTIWKLANDEE